MSTQLSNLNSAPTEVATSVSTELEKIRPAWQTRNLIVRVERLLPVDPSSACQRLLNAAIFDLREKIVIAGVDIANEAAKNHSLPPVEKDEDINNYSTARIIDLSYHMGLLSRPEWRRIARCYEIRRDLEHEDNEYEAGVEDCVYIFKTCIDVVLSRDPIQLVRVADVKQIVESDSKSVASIEIIEDFAAAPAKRQIEITGFLVNYALDASQPEIVQQNAFGCIKALNQYLANDARLALAKKFQEKVGRNNLDERHSRVAFAAGYMPYLRRASRATLFGQILSEFQAIGTDWSGHSKHGDLLRRFGECGGFEGCPPELHQDFLLWMVLTYIGKSGGVTQYGNVRNVYYSNSAAPLIAGILEANTSLVAENFAACCENELVLQKTQDQHVARRLKALADLFEKITPATPAP